jgi:NTE family protein
VTPHREKDVLALQGGGALGAYQAGVYEALCEAGHMPRWIAGTSIGAINAAIIAGNQPDNRVSRLREFWEGVSSRLVGWPLKEDGNARRIFNETSAALSVTGGVPSFFDPRIPPAVMMPQGTQEAVSVYDTGPLQATIKKVIDLLQCFDTAFQAVGPEPVTASATLSSGFPPVEIDGEQYWGGIGLQHCPRIHCSVPKAAVTAA